MAHMPSKSSFPQQMTDSWIVIDDQDESDFVVIEDDEQIKIVSSPKPSPQTKRPLTQNNNQQNNINLNHNKPITATKNAGCGPQNKKRKWKVLYSLPSTGTQASVNAANLDSYVMDQHAQLFDKRDLFSYQQRIVKVK